MRDDSVGSSVQCHLENHFVVGVAQHRPYPEGYVDRLAQSGQGAHDDRDVLEAMSRDCTRSRAAENGLVLEKQGRGAQKRYAPPVHQPEESIACAQTASKRGDDNVRVQDQPHEARLYDIL